VIQYGGDRPLRDRIVADASVLRELAAGEPGVTWVDVQGLGDEATLRAVGAAFDLDPLSLEQAVNVPQRARSEVLEHHHVVIARVPAIEADDSVVVPQVCFVIGDRVLLTFQERFFGFFEPVRERIRVGLGRIRSSGVDYLAYALVDAMIDRYYPVVEQLAERVAELEDEVTNDPGRDVLRRLHVVRSQLTVVRRIGWPQREAIFSLLRDPSPFVSDDVRRFLRDTHGHVCQRTGRTR